MKQLFRRVAAALPGMETKEQTEAMVDVNLEVNRLQVFQQKNCRKLQKKFRNRSTPKQSKHLLGPGAAASNVKRNKKDPIHQKKKKLDFVQVHTVALFIIQINYHFPKNTTHYNFGQTLFLNQRCPVQYAYKIDRHHCATLDF